MRKCETFGCKNQAERQYQIAPGTNVWLCEDCADNNGLDTDSGNRDNADSGKVK
jgi:hypothetical protein